MTRDQNRPAGLRTQFKDYMDTVEKPLLALDALSKLYRQFANKPEFHSLIQTLLLTLSGQFAVTSAFALLRAQDSSEGKSVFSATGQFKQAPTLESLVLSPDLGRYFLAHPSTSLIAELELPESCANYKAILLDSHVHLVCPLIHNDSLLGIIGLGERATKRDFEREDTELLDTLVSTNTPLVVSSYHFWEMTAMSAWYLDILNNVIQGVFVFDAENNLRKANRAGLDILGRFLPEPPNAISLDGVIIHEVFPEAIFADWSRRFVKANIESRGSTIKELVAAKESVDYTFEGYVTGISAGTEYGTDYIVTLGEVTDRKREEEERRIRLERVERQKTAINILATDEAMEAGNVAKAAQIATEVIAEASEVERTSIWLFENGQSRIRCIDLFERSTGRHSQGACLEASDFPRYFEALHLGRVVDAGSAQTDPRTEEFTEARLKPHGIVSMLDSVVRVSGESVGVICQEHVGLELVWQNDEVRFAAEVADQVGQALAIAERKRAEHQRRDLQDKLEKAERMESLGILAGGVAHDLNNMLGPLVGYPELILRKISEDSPIRKQVQRIGAAAQDAADVIQDLLTMARRGRYEMQPTNLNSVIEAYLDSPSYMQLAEKRSEIKVEVKLDSTIGAIDGSAPHLSKVVMNLIVNAYDAMPESGSLVIRTAEQEVTRLKGGQQEVNPGPFIALEVKDTGTGISSEDIDKIFEPYYSKKKMGRSGSGLGLSVVYGITKDHGGYYDILSTIGEGTTFILYFPVSTKAVDRQIEEPDCVGGTESVLVVDDVAEQREIAEEYLRSIGYDVTSVSSGREALQYLESHEVDVVLLDMILERDFDGLDTYRQILELRPKQRALIISGYSATERVQKAQELGAGKYIKKPYTLNTINGAIREELARPHT